MTALLHAAIPADWRPYSARDVVVIARPPVDTGWFCTTVLIGREEVEAHVPLPELLDGTSSMLGDDVEVVGRRFSIADGLERVSKLVCFDVPGGPGRVAQLQCLVASRDIAGSTRTVVQFAGTCAFDELGNYGPLFVRVIESIRLGSPGGSQPVGGERGR